MNFKQSQYFLMPNYNSNNLELVHFMPKVTAWNVFSIWKRLVLFWNNNYIKESEVGLTKRSMASKVTTWPKEPRGSIPLSEGLSNVPNKHLLLKSRCVCTTCIYSLWNFTAVMCFIVHIFYRCLEFSFSYLQYSSPVCCFYWHMSKILWSFSKIVNMYVSVLSDAYNSLHIPIVKSNLSQLECFISYALIYFK